MTTLVGPIRLVGPRHLRVPRPLLVVALAAGAVALLLTALPGAYAAVRDGIARIPHADARRAVDEDGAEEDDVAEERECLEHQR